MAVLILVKESEFGFQLSSAGTLAKQVLKTPNRKSKREQMLVAFGFAADGRISERLFLLAFSSC